MRSIQRSVSLMVGLLLLGMAFAGPPRARAAAPGQGAPRSAADRATLHLQPLKKGAAKRLIKKNKKKTQEAASHVMRGRVVNPDGSPAEGVLVQASGQAAHSDEQGRFKLNKLPAGAQVVHFIGQRHEAKKGKVDVQKDQEVLAPVTLKPVDPYKPAFHGPVGSGAAAWLTSSIIRPPDMDAKQPPDRLRELDLLAAPGQYETRALAFFANQDLDHPEGKVVWRGPAGEKLDQHTRLRWTQRRRTRKHNHKRWAALLWWRFLFDRAPAQVKRNRLRQLVLTVHVPDDAPAGTHHGRLTLTAGGRTVATLPVQLRIAGFHLATPDKRVGIYYGGMLGDRKWINREMRDMRAHGVSVLNNTGQMRPEFHKNDDGEITVDTSQLRNLIELQRSHGFPGPYTCGLRPDQIRSAIGLPTHPEKKAYQAMVQSDKYKQVLRKALDAVDRLQQNMGVKVMLLFGDEVQRKSESRFKSWLYTAKLARRFTDTTIYETVSNGTPERRARVAKMKPYIDIRNYAGWRNDGWLRHGGSFKKMRADLKKYDASAWVYRLIWGAPDDHEIVRAVNGFWLWRSPMQAHMPWIYHWTGGRMKNPFDTLDNHYRDMGYAFRDHKTNKLVSTLDWEAYRQGYNDLRYLATLEQAMDHAPADDAHLAAARTLLDQMRRGPEPANKSAQALSPEDYQQRRQNIADMIDALGGQ